MMRFLFLLIVFIVVSCSNDNTNSVENFWQLSTIADSGSVQSIYFDNGVLLAAVNVVDHDNNSYFSKLYRSTDLGKTWGSHKHADATLRKMNYLKPGTFIAFSESDNTIWFTTNDGSNWTVSHLVSQIGYMATLYKDTIYCATPDGILSSQDGINWVKLNWNLPSIESNIPGYIFFSADGSILVYLYSLLSNSFLARSTDYGETWHSVTGFTTNLVQTTNGSIVASSMDSIRRSTDNGATWQNVYSPPESHLMGSLQFLTHGNKIIGYSGLGRLFISTDDGLNWEMITDGLNETNLDENDNYGISYFNILSATTDSSGYFYLGTQNGGIFKGTKPGIMPSESP